MLKIFTKPGITLELL